MKNRISDQLSKSSNEKRAQFMARLVPMVDSKRILGLKKSDLLSVYRSLSPEQIREFLQDVPHRFFEEDQLHILAMNALKTPQSARDELRHFLPWIDSWALTDSLTFPEISDDDLLDLAEYALSSENEYEKRLGILWIMKRSLKRDDAGAWVERALKAGAGEETKQLVDAKGWLLCETMIKDPLMASGWIAGSSLSVPVRRRAISKCMDSRRIDETSKMWLRSVRSQLVSRS